MFSTPARNAYLESGAPLDSRRSFVISKFPRSTAMATGEPMVKSFQGKLKGPKAALGSADCSRRALTSSTLPVIVACSSFPSRSCLYPGVSKASTTVLTSDGVGEASVCDVISRGINVSSSMTLLSCGEGADEDTAAKLILAADLDDRCLIIVLDTFGLRCPGFDDEPDPTRTGLSAARGSGECQALATRFRLSVSNTSAGEKGLSTGMVSFMLNFSGGTAPS
mmetsp:Transcript_12237/g.28531  ORF Transcript_12237/g.28531 Transcript_12237/m.28531 type:complete len:223 (-) Transcript_12237:714-1382(-)